MTRFYNTLTRTIEEFVPMEPGQVRMYTCGPTVHDHTHIGNFRTFVWEDLLRRSLEHLGYQVTQVMNITDVDDKTINKSLAQGMSLADYTERYTKSFFEGLDVLHVKRAEFYPRATDHIPEMIHIIEVLRDKGMTYESQGSIYYRIASFPSYGRLSGVQNRELRDGARIDSDEYEKESARDFALWKGVKPGEPSWPSPFGAGRPGWHLECSAMSIKYLGETFDIHTGGVDNIFPHHENEIAQSEAYTGRPFVRYWLHSAHLLVESEKMAKSLGNFYTLRELLEQGHDPRAIRWLLLGTHYRRNLNFSFDGIAVAAREVARLDDFRRRLDEELAKSGEPGAARAAAGEAAGALGPRLSDPPAGAGGGSRPSGGDPGAPGSGSALAEQIRSAEEEFSQCLADDLNISSAVGAVFRMVRDTNAALDRGSAGRAEIQSASEALDRFDGVLAVLDRTPAVLDEEVEGMIRRRQEARRTRDFAEADSIRDELASRGILLEDTPQGVRWKRR
jgi:cysteinyl-tRNA synthetase